MKIIRYLDPNGQVRHGALRADGSAWRIAGDVFGPFDVTTEAAQVAQLLAPVAPAQVLGIGLNYRRHAEESGMAIPAQPVLFMKGVNAVQHPGAPIVLPTTLRSDEVDYECELAVVIGKTCRNATRATALDHVLGYTCANDVSARDWQLKKGGGQWCRGKTFDTFAPLGPCLALKDEIRDPGRLRITTTVNGEVLQDSNTSDLIFDIPALIEFLSGSTTLAPGTVILTGTPQGVGMARKPQRWLRAGDTVVVEIEGIGRLENPVVRES